MILDGAGGADTDDVFHTVEVKQLVGVDADGGHTHAGCHNGYGNALPCAGITLYTAYIVYQNGVFKKVFCYEFVS